MEEPVPFKPCPDINRHVLLTMTPSQIMKMSLSSEEMKKLMKKNMFKVDEVWIEYPNIRHTYAIFWIKVGLTFLKVISVNTLMHKFNGSNEHWERLARYRIPEDALLYYHFKTRCVGEVAFDPVRAIYNYVCDLFNVDPSQLYVKSFSIQQKNDVPSTTVKRRIVTVVEESFEEDLDLCDQRDVVFMMIEKTRVHPSMRANNAFLKVPAVIHRNIREYINICFTQFEGQHGLFENAKLTGFYVKAFLRMWSQKKMENLKSFIAYQEEEKRFHQASVLKALEAKRADPDAGILDGLKVETRNAAKRERIYPYQSLLKVFERIRSNSKVFDLEAQKVEDLNRERFYPYRSIITEYHTFSPDTFDCQDGIDVVRDSDGKRATIKISSQHFMFFVWP